MAAIWAMAMLAVAPRPFAAVKIPHATVRLKPSLVATPRDSFSNVVVEIELEPGWHTYYSNPGDTGVPTAFKWKLPPGWSVAEQRFPPPLRHLEDGMTSFIYNEKASFLVVLKAGPKAVSGKFSLDAKFFVCQQECTVGLAHFESELKIGPAQKASWADDSSGATTGLGLKLPVKNLASVNATLDKTKINLSFLARARGQLLDFVCADPGVLDSAAESVRPVIGYTGQLELKRSEYSNSPPSRIRGILTIKRESHQPEYFWIDEPLKDLSNPKPTTRKKP